MPGLNILVVDDDPDFAESMAELLELKGYRTMLAHDGIEALERVRNGEFDMTIMDMKMPQMDGAETLIKIRAIRPDAKVIMVTGHVSEEAVRKAMDNGALKVLYKPVETDELLSILESEAVH